MHKKVVLTSGSFDPLHVGHIKYLRAAKKLGDILVVAIKGNESVKEKKKRHFMDEQERKLILESLDIVDKVIVIDAPELAYIAAQAIALIKPDIYATGEKSVGLDVALVCSEFGVKIKGEVGGKRIRSSSELLKNYKQTPWQK